MMLRPKRIHVLFFLIGCCFILYLILSSRLNEPNLNADYMKWKHVDKKLTQMEMELKQNQEVVSKMKNMINDLKDVSTQTHKTQIEQKNEEVQMPTVPKVVGDEPPRMVTRLTKMTKFDASMCPLKRNVVPKTDIQMMSLYERMMFDDKDGGVWKQGWEIEYNEKQWNNQNLLKVFIVPHSHNDPGWLRTFEEYYRIKTLYIFQSIVSKLQEYPQMKFVWAEISFLSMWWKMHATVPEKEAFKNLLKNGQLEIVTGGWVMNDEANSHWLSVVQQLTAGHQWLVDNLDYKPKNAWSIDPFGHSSSQPYLLKLAGLRNSVIQRVHYRVKKELALNRELEFQWRQLWDSVGRTDMFTHMMPFYSYDVPHSCGPDPKICCQFDFRRLPGNSIQCPWNEEPKKIIQKNVNERSSLIIDQWRKKAQLYKTNAILFPLGDDFRYNSPNEFEQQYKNYEALIDYINNKESFYTRVQFGTLEDYFSAVHEEIKSEDFPVLSGDFFTYSDRNQHYWSGYFTSRPFYKSMDRVLLGYVRSAETIVGQAWSVVSAIKAVQLRDLVTSARQTLALFQHHDGVTGTSKDFVVNDYSEKMLDAILHCQSAIQQSAYYLLKQPEILSQSHSDVYFHVDDLWQKRDQIPIRITIALDRIAPSKRIVLYNSLLFKRQEILTVYVTVTNVEVYDSLGNPVMAQLSPIVTGENKLRFASGKYQLSFLVTVEPLSLSVYTVKLRGKDKLNKYTTYAKIREYSGNFEGSLPSVFHVTSTTLLTENITIQAGNSTRVVLSPSGYVRAVIGADGTVHHAHMDFVKYGSQQGQDSRSGAYLFMPPEPAYVLPTEPHPAMLAVEGPLLAAAYVAHAQRTLYEIIVKVTVYNNPSLPLTAMEISNTFLITKWTHEDIELAMRFSTSIANGDVFYTDVNGMQMIKRRYFGKLPLQANFYPLPSAAYIEDNSTRFTILTSSPLGVAALAPGQIEIMHDRRLLGDDNRGLQQSVQDNVRTRHTFQIIIEKYTPCQGTPALDLVSGQLSLGSHVTQQAFLQPLVRMQYNDVSSELKVNTYTPLRNATKSIGADVVLASFVANLNPKGFGMTFQRMYLDECHENKVVNDNYPVGEGQIYIPDLAPVLPDQVFESSLTYNRINKKPLTNALLNICPMEVKSVFLKNNVS